MAVISEEELKKQISGGHTADTYLLFGDEGYLKDLYVKKLSAFVKDDVFDLQQFTGDSPLQEVYDAVVQIPLFTDRKCVILTDYDYDHAAVSEFERFCALLSEPHGETLLLVKFDAIEVDHKKGARAKKMIAAAEKGGGKAVLLNRRRPAELAKMLTDGASKRGCRMDRRVAEYLIESAGNDILVLQNELEKLCCFAPGEEITRETVDRVAVKTAEASIYDLAREIFSHNAARAMEISDSLFTMRFEPAVVFYTLAAAYVDMARVYFGGREGKTNAEIAALFGYKGKEFVLQRAAGNLRKMDWNRLRLSFSVLLETDRLLKSGADSRTAIEELIVQLICIAARGERVDQA